jgi:glycine cleavage system H protein
MHFPDNLRYTREHEWVRLDGNVATVGITDFAQSELGEIVYVEVDSLDDTLSKDDVFGTIEAVKTTSDLFMPMSGKVVAFNTDIDEKEGDNPALINEDPYDKGWLIRIEISDPGEWDDLLTAEAYQELVH